MTTVAEEWLTVAETAEKLKCSPRFVYRELTRKNLRGTKLKGPGWRIHADDVRTYMDAQANVSRVRRSA